MRGVLTVPRLEGSRASFPVALAQFLLLHLRNRRSVTPEAMKKFQTSFQWDATALYDSLRSVCERTIETHLTRVRQEKRGFIARVFASAERNRRADLEITKECLYREPVGKLIYHLEDMLSIARKLLEETLLEKA